ncbi:MAG: STAS domain-containing protein [Sulfitobacter sp.]
MADQLSLSGKLDLAAVGGLHADLLARIGQDITLNMAHVTHLGALCVQTMIAAAKSTHDAGCSFHMTETSDRVLGQLAAMGLTPEIIMEGRT